MKTILLALTFLFSISAADAAEGIGKTKRNAGGKEITYSGEKKYKKTYGKRKAVTKKMFDGEGPAKSKYSMFGKVSPRTSR